MTSRGVGTLTTATILFTDIVNSAAMRAQLGEESAEDHFRQLFSLQRSVTTAHGAVFIKSPLPSRSMQLLRVHKLSTRRTGAPTNRSYSGRHSVMVMYLGPKTMS